MEWLTLVLNFFQPLVLKCFEKTSSEDPQLVLREAYDPVNQRMDPSLVNQAIPRARQAANRARTSMSKAERKQFPRLSRSDLYEVAEKGLIDAMNATPEKMGSIRSVASALTDEDDD